MRELIPSARIEAGTNAVPLMEVHSQAPDISHLPNIGEISLESFLANTSTDSLLVLHKGRKIWQWKSDHCDWAKPHIVFSISKSITAMLTGILVDQGVIETDRPIIDYLPGTQGGAYADCTVRHLLDMTVALDFEEQYLSPSGDYFRYRNATAWNPVDQTRHCESLETFLYSIGKAGFSHGEIFNYKSPNTDLLGLLLERASGSRLAELLSQLIWKPMGAESDAYVTVDRALLARAAGGICVTIEDLARFGQLVLNLGVRGETIVIPRTWVEDTQSSGNIEAWRRGDLAGLLPDGRYRNKWYQIGNRDKCITALGIHGQWLYINPSSKVVIVKLSSQVEPLDERLDKQYLQLFEFLSRQFAIS